jgi:hypothetical protein
MDAGRRLFGDGGGDPGMAISQRADPDAGDSIEVALPVHVEQIAALAAVDDQRITGVGS